MRIIKNFQQFLGESEDEPIQFTTSTLGRTGEIELDDYSDDEENHEEGAEDHEVGMAQNLLDDIIKNAMELKEKIGDEEMNLPGWIQDHISQSQNYINQANTGYHELSEAAHIDMAYVKKEIKKFRSGEYPYNSGENLMEDLAKNIIGHLGYKNVYYAILPVADADMEGFNKDYKDNQIQSFELSDEYPADYLFIHEKENVLKDFVNKYWPDDEGNGEWVEEIKKYQK